MRVSPIRKAEAKAAPEPAAPFHAPAPPPNRQLIHAVVQRDAGRIAAGRSEARQAKTDATPTLVQAPSPPTPPTGWTMASRTLAHAPDGTPDSRPIIGVSEVVEFKIKPVSNLGLARVANWYATPGSPQHGAGLATFRWTAPEKAGWAIIKAVDPFGGASCSATLQVILPTGIAITKAAPISYPTGMAGAGMHIMALMPPNHVSFHNSGWLEVAEPTTGVKGYFDKLQKADPDSLVHKTNPNYVPITSDSSGNYGSDQAATKPGKLPPPWEFGTFEWPISNRIGRYGGGGDGVEFAETRQHFMIFSSGTVAIYKAGASVLRHPK